MSEDGSATRLTNKPWVLGACAAISLVWIGILGWLFLFSHECNHYGDGILETLVYCRDSNEIGDFLAGGFAPLAFLWLVATVIVQSQELAAQRDEMRESRVVYEAQAKAMKEQSKVMLRQSTMQQEAERLKVFDIYIGSIAEQIRFNVEFATADYTVERGDDGTLWLMAETSDKVTDASNDRVVAKFGLFFKKTVLDRVDFVQGLNTLTLWDSARFKNVFDEVERAFHFAESSGEIIKLKCEAVNLDELYRAMSILREKAIDYPA